MRKILSQPIAWFVILFVIFFFQQLFLREVFYCCDNLLITIPTKLYLIDSLKHGIFPLWNPYILSGMPFLADINLGLLNPLNILYSMFSPFGALTLFILTSILIGVFGMYSLGTQLRLSKAGALISSIIFGFSGTMIVYTNNTSLLSVASLTPLALWAWMGYFEQSSFVRLTLLVLLLSLQIFAGHPQLTYYSWILYILMVFVIPAKQKIRRIGLVSIFVLLVTAIQTLPFLEFVRESTRLNLDYQYATFDSLHPLNLLRLLFPSVVGNAAQGTAWAQGGSVYGYVGMIAFVLAWFAPRKEKLIKFFWVVALSSLILAFGKYTPLYYIAYRLLPGLGSFRSPEHFLFLYTIAVAVLSGFGADEVMRKGVSGGLGRLGLAGGIFSAFIGALFIARRPLILVLFIVSNISTHIATKISQIDSQVFATILRDIGWNFLFIALVLVVFVITFSRKYSRKVKEAVLILLVFSELFIYSRHNVFTIPQATAGQWFKATSELFPSIDKKQDRILISSSVYPYPGAKKFGETQLAEESAWQVHIMRPNLNMLYGISSIDGYSSLIWTPYQEWLGTPITDPTGVNLHGVSQEKMNMLGVKYTFNKDQKVTQNKNPLPRIFFISNGKISSDGIAVKLYTPNEVALSVNTKVDGKLVFMDTNYPGWKATVDGRNVPIVPYEKVFKSVQISSGVHEVTFDYQPEVIHKGSLLSILGILLLLVINKKEKNKDNVDS